MPQPTSKDLLEVIATRLEAVKRRIEMAEEDVKRGAWGKAVTSLADAHYEAGRAESYIVILGMIDRPRGNRMLAMFGKVKKQLTSVGRKVHLRAVKR